MTTETNPLYSILSNKSEFGYLSTLFKEKHIKLKFKFKRKQSKYFKDPSFQHSHQ